ncbi:MAG: PAS domain S-box protein [Candidatus Bipolaricaulota bacterium]|nr:PAS domain S-box protein [Candidatus Bipolaricaulota bacterium]
MNLKSGSTREYEIRTKEKGTRIWDFSSAPFDEVIGGERRLVLSMADGVTARKKAGSKVEKERDRAQKYLDLAGSIIVLIDKDRKVKEINQKGFEILGYEEEEIIEKDWFDNFIPERVRETII